MKWIIGLSLRDEHSAPAAFARWAGDDARFTVVHVIDRARASFASGEVREQMRAAARDALEATARKAGLPPDRTEIVVVPKGRTSAVLAEAAAERNASGIVVSRRTPFGADGIVNLGSTARRLLRSLPVPVVVVPPELSHEGIGGGPVLLAGDAQHDARRAKTFAIDVATVARRPVELVHVYREPFKPGATGVAQSYLNAMYERYREQQHDKLERWSGSNDLADLKRHETEGHAVGRIAGIARDLDACMVVCASRQLTTPDRVFSSSVGSQLAAMARFPVAVVPHA